MTEEKPKMASISLIIGFVIYTHFKNSGKSQVDYADNVFGMSHTAFMKNIKGHTEISLTNILFFCNSAHTNIFSLMGLVDSLEKSLKNEGVQMVAPITYKKLLIKANEDQNFKGRYLSIKEMKNLLTQQNMIDIFKTITIDE